MKLKDMTDVLGEDRLVELSDKDFRRLSEFIYAECGIKMPAAKKVMLEARLRKRLRCLELKTYREYCDYLFSRNGIEHELVHMIDVVTTNKTDFFREPSHFDHLVKRTLPELMSSSGAGVSRKLSVWSAGCSTGEEPYTLGMVISEFAATVPDYSYSIIATDISTRVLEAAARGIYHEDRTVPVPPDFKRKYLMRGKDKNRGLVRVVPELREKIRFSRLNFMAGDFGLREPMDIIFCRNVIIYFDRPAQERLLNRFYEHLSPGGYIFLGHSETINGLDVSFVQNAPTIYRRPK